MNILFICKHNRFRSRVATSYFNKINKNKEYKARGAGIDHNYCSLDKNEVAIAKDLGIDIKGKPQQINDRLLKWQDKIIIVADDVKKNQIKDHEKYNITIWKIHDIVCVKDVRKEITRAVRQIKEKVDELVKELK